jgi:IS30 family transposase
MRVSHETIYLSLFVQSRGALRKELTRYLRMKRSRVLASPDTASLVAVGEAAAP